MATGKKPDFRVMFPVAETSGNGRDKETKTVWHRHGAAWKRNGGSIGIVLDIGVHSELSTGRATGFGGEEREDGREPGDDPNSSSTAGLSMCCTCNRGLAASTRCSVLSTRTTRDGSITLGAGKWGHHSVERRDSSASLALTSE